VAQVGDGVAKRLQLVIGEPFGKFMAVDFCLGLGNAFA